MKFVYILTICYFLNLTCALAQNDSDKYFIPLEEFDRAYYLARISSARRDQIIEECKTPDGLKKYQQLLIEARRKGEQAMNEHNYNYARELFYEAIDYSTIINSISPDLANDIYNLGKAYEALEDYRECNNQYQEAYEKIQYNDQSNPLKIKYLKEIIRIRKKVKNVDPNNDWVVKHYQKILDKIINNDMPPDTVGSVKMLENKTLMLHCEFNRGYTLVNFGNRYVKPEDKCYAKILELTGDIKLGDTKYFNLEMMNKIYEAL